MFPERLKKPLAKMARYCALAEKSPRQIREKLRKNPIHETDIELILQELRKQGFLNEERFAHAFSNDKLKFNQWGRNRIRLELKSHGIDEILINQALDHLDIEIYIEILEQLSSKKWKSLEKEDNPLIRKKKTIDYLVRKGFEFDLILASLDSIMSAK